MANSLLNIIAFLLTTIFYYYMLSPKLTYQDIGNPNKMAEYESKKYKNLGIYLFIIVATQFFINIYAIASKCGGNVKDNLGSAASYTIFPWICLFGFVLLMITLFPGFKRSFSDVVGYFYISSSANKILTELLVDQNIQEQIDETNMTQIEMDKIAKVADTIIKICGNTSILINRMVPGNFEEFWRILSPLKKRKYKPTQTENEYIENDVALPIKIKLLELVVSKDNVGEALWFVYTGILIVSIISMKILTNKCYVSVATMEKNYQDFQKQEAQDQEEKNKTKQPVYTLD